MCRARRVSKDKDCNTDCIGPFGRCCECNKLGCRICSHWKERWGSPNNSSDYTNRGFGPIGMKFSGEKLENVPYGIKKNYLI